MALLEVRNLTRRFGGLTAVDRASFEVAEGEIFGLIGPNGAGKTTTFNMIAGALPPSDGAIIFDGHALQGLPADAVARQGIARTFQNVRLFKQLTVEQNVIAGGIKVFRSGILSGLLALPAARAEMAALRRRAAELMERLGLSDVAHVPPDELPYGRQRLVELARALAGRPKLLLLDEPTAGMNPAESSEITGLIRELCDQGTTILLIEHDMAVVMSICDRIVVLHNGRKIAEGPPADIRRNPQVIEAYLGSGIYA